VLLAGYDDARLADFLRRPRAALTPATLTSARAIRRELALVREQGFAASVDELEEGLASVSVGVQSDSGALVGIVNVSGLSLRFDAAARAGAVQRMRTLAVAVEAALRRP
jgi:DNA-binding IclR family transcriptional regulator